MKPTFGRPGVAANRDPKIALMRQADTRVASKGFVGGRQKIRERPRPEPSMPRFKCLEKPDDAE